MEKWEGEGQVLCLCRLFHSCALNPSKNNRHAQIQMLFEELSQRRLARANHTSVRPNLCSVFSCQYLTAAPHFKWSWYTGMPVLSSAFCLRVLVPDIWSCSLWKLQLTICHCFLFSSNTAYPQWSSFVLSTIIYETIFFFLVVIDILSLHCIAAIFKMLRTEFGINADVEHFPIHFAAQVAFKFLLRNFNKAK